MDKQEDRTVIITDGAYSGIENTQLAANKNIELIITSLTGKAAPDILADFKRCRLKNITIIVNEEYVQPVIIHLIVTGSLHFELTELIVSDVPL